MLHHKQKSAGEEMHPLNKLLVNVMVSNVVDGLFYKLLTDYIRSHMYTSVVI